MRGPRIFVLIVAASFSGVLGSELLCRSIAFRDAMGLTTDWVVAENLRRAARSEPVDAAKVDRELALLRAQFGDEKTFLSRVRSNGFSIWYLREKIGDQLRSLEGLEKQIVAGPVATERECHDFYEMHRTSFMQPVRFRASHVFLAAPSDAAPEVVESKQAEIETLAVRLAGGEALPQLAAQASEDEATKSRGGDLGFFSSARVPQEFFSEVEKLGVAKRSKPFRSHLGFHIVEVTGVRAPRLLSFEEARGEIFLALANERRALIVERLTDMLSAGTYARSN
jgi:parvulin-like peptidyl-prolyl isomerase